MGMCESVFWETRGLHRAQTLCQVAWWVGGLVGRWVGGSVGRWVGGLVTALQDRTALGAAMREIFSAFAASVKQMACSAGLR